MEINKHNPLEELKKIPTYSGDASNLAGEAGKFIEKNLESAAVAADGYGDYNRITEHPDFGGIRGNILTIHTTMWVEQ